MVENKRYAYTQSPELTLNATLDLLEMERQMLIFIGSNNFYLGREYFSEDFSKLGTLNEIDIESRLRRLEGLSNGLPKNSDVLKCLRFQYQRVLSNPVEMAASNKSSLQMQRAPVTETNITEAIKLIDSLIAQVDLPTFNKMPFPPDPLWNTSMSMYWRDPRMAENIYRSTVEKLRVELALRSYHFKNGEYPSKLEELAPQILKTIPTDYRHNGQSYYYKSDAANDSFFLDDMIKEKK